MFYGIDMGGIAVEVFPDHPAYFTMIADPGAQEFCPGIKNEIACHLLPYVLEFVMIGPDVVASSGYHILTCFWKKAGGAGFDTGAYVTMTIKNTELLGKNGLRGKSKHEDKQKQYVSLFFHTTKIYGHCSNSQFSTTSTLHHKSKPPLKWPFPPQQHYIKVY